MYAKCNDAIVTFLLAIIITYDSFIYKDYPIFFFFFQAEDGIRDKLVTGVQTCALPIWVESEAAFRQALQQFVPDVILTDHSMPQFTAADALRIAREAHSDTPVIIVTGSLDEETAADYIKAGAADYIVKHHLERLPSAVARALDLQRARAEQAHAEDARRQTEERYRTLVEGVRDVIFALTLDGAISALNPAFETITGWSRDEWLGQPFEGLVQAADVPDALELFGRG